MRDMVKKVLIFVVVILVVACGSSATPVVAWDVSVDTLAEDEIGTVDADANSTIDTGDVNSDNACLIPTPSQCKNDLDCTSPEPCKGNPKCTTVWNGDDCARLCEYEDFCPGQDCYQNKCCSPSCEWKKCGDDGCGGTCGLCSGQDECIDGQCVCQPYCAGKNCGPDSCGGSCGTCEGQDSCFTGQCVCQPYCAGKNCGNDGCGGVCGVCVGQTLCVEDHCVCQPDCDGKECGSDGCGGTCGLCSIQEECIQNKCVCQPNCEGKECGDDGCGGVCSTCVGLQKACIDGQCVCQPNCEGKECGIDGCEGTCGQCSSSESCWNGGCVPFMEDVCNDGMDNDQDKTMDCADKNCMLDVIGEYNVTVTAFWQITYGRRVLYKDGGDVCNYSYCTYLGSDGGDDKEIIGFGKEISIVKELHCTHFPEDLLEGNLVEQANDFWIATDGGVLIENTTLYDLFVFDQFIYEPSLPYDVCPPIYEGCDYDDADGTYGIYEFNPDPNGLLCPPPLAEPATTILKPGDSVEYPVLPPTETHSIMVRWTYYQLPPPTE